MNAWYDMVAKAVWDNKGIFDSSITNTLPENLYKETKAIKETQQKNLKLQEVRKKLFQNLSTIASAKQNVRFLI